MGLNSMQQVNLYDIQTYVATMITPATFPGGSFSWCYCILMYTGRFTVVTVVTHFMGWLV